MQFSEDLVESVIREASGARKLKNCGFRAALTLRSGRQLRDLSVAGRVSPEQVGLTPSSRFSP